MDKNIDNRLANGEFKQKWDSEEYQFKGDGKEGMWALASRNFVSESHGQVLVMSSEVDRSNGVASLTEIPELLKKEDVVVNHIDIDTWKQQEYPAAAILDSSAKQAIVTSLSLENQEKYLETDNINKLNRLLDRATPEQQASMKQATDNIEGLWKGYEGVNYDKLQMTKDNTVIAKPGRIYSGNIIEVAEDTTIQKTGTGKFIIHETDNLPGIKEQGQSYGAKITYDADGKGDLRKKVDDLGIAKEKMEKSNQNTLER